MKTHPDTHHDVTSNTLFGFWVYLMTDAVMFATFFAAYAVLHNGTYGGPTSQDIFSLPFTLIETIVLLTSSFACGLSLVNAPRISTRQILGWFGVTFILGALFMCMELSEFIDLTAKGFSWQRSAFLSSYFVLIGLHGLHILAGLLMMLVFAVQLTLCGLTEIVLRRLTCLKIYWHFLYFIWIFTFTLVYLFGAK